MARRTWWLTLVAAFLAGALLRVYLLSAFALMVAAVSGLALWQRAHALDGVIYRRRLSNRRGFVGETIEMQVEVENHKFMPLTWLQTEDPIPKAIGPLDERQLRHTHRPDIGLLIGLFSLRWYERDRRTYTMLLRQRGIYRLGPPRLASGDLFGLFEASHEDEALVEYLTVFPQPASFQSLRFPADEPYGERRARRRLYEDPTRPMGIRDYHPEDDFRRIHWPATASTGRLQVKVYQPVSAQVMVVCLNVLTVPRYWEGVDLEILEHLVKVTAALVQRGLQDEYQVGLISNGALMRSDRPLVVPPGRSPAQLLHLLTALAGVTTFTTSSFDRYLLSQAGRLPYGATLVIVTAITDEPLTEAILRLKRHGWRITLLSFAHEPPPEIPGVGRVHLPYR